MLLQTNSYVVPKEKRSEHARLVRRFKQCLSRLGCDDYEVYEQVGNNWTSDQTGGRFVQIMRFRDRRHQLSVQAAEKTDPVAQAIIAEFCDMVNFPYQQQQGLFAVGFYTSLLAFTPKALPHQQAVPVSAAEVSAASPEVVAGMPESSLPTSEQEEVPPAEEIVVAEAPTEMPSPASVFADGPPLAEPLPEQEHAAEPEEPEAADAEHVPSGRNGDSAEHLTEPTGTSGEQPTEIGVAALEELIKQRFGSIAVAPPAAESPVDLQAVEPPAPEPQTAEARSAEAGMSEPQISEPIFSSSGIGEILDASMGDDPDLDIVLPAELLGSPPAENMHQQKESPSQASHAGEQNRG
jgi:hypothetical protein